MSGRGGVGVNAAVDSVLARQDDLSRKMRGLKKKRRKFTRGLSPRAPSGGNQKLNREQEASMKLVKLKMITISTKLNDQRIVWQKRLSELDVSSKKRISTVHER